jgi:tRNA (guanine37-N1)-methyltransferase
MTSNQTRWHACVLTLFPEMFPGPLGHSLAGKALQDNLWHLSTIHMRDFATDMHKTVDDTCFGGGAGMVIKADIANAALEAAVKQFQNPPAIIYLTPRGAPLKQNMVRGFIDKNPSGVVLLCGRYEGVDDRVIQHWRTNHNLQEISIGDYILSGGEAAAHVLIDACVRLLPGVVGKQESLESESFELDLLEFPQYTKPRNWQGTIVPEILLSGDHQKIAAWRLQQAKEITRERRPDLWEAYLKKSALPEIG